MELTLQFIEQYKPQNSDDSGKYCWFIYNFLKDNIGKNIEVYSCIDKYCFRIEDNMWMTDVKNIVFNNYLYNTVFCGHIAKECTEMFFSMYLQYGKCFIIPHNYEHHIDNIYRWDYLDDNTRQCRWCGKKQFKFIKYKHIKKILWADYE